ncbi:glycosyltransferase family 2 protein [bacterium]|nr:glycosyltransferase family 2 protein [bacterium]
MQVPVLSIIIPCYNEEEAIENTLKTLLDYLKELTDRNIVSEKSFLYLVDDGSSDKTYSILEKWHNENPDKIKVLKFSKNFGNQKAILAGLLEVRKYNPDCCVTIDADLQQDERTIEKFLEEFKKGNQIVCGIRNDRKTDSFSKKFTALAFYKFINLLGVDMEPNHSDFRLVSKEVLEVLSRYREVNLFLRGVFQEFGFKKQYVYFDVRPRLQGESKFNFFSLMTLALQGITSFSIVPLRFVSVTGFIMFFTSLLLAIHAVYEKVANQNTVSGWATIVMALAIIGGLQILCIGIIGEYLGQLFQEVKARPRYIVEKELE